MQSFTDLEAWKSGMDLVECIYVLTTRFPQEERYGLTSQIRRAANSVVANTAEGFGRYTYPDKANKYVIARGECAEVETFLLISIRIGFATSESAQKALTCARRTGRLLSGLISACRRS